MAKEPRPLHGKVAAITGGARGIGRATAQAFVREGMKVAIGDLDLEAAERTATELGDGTIGLPLNVTDRGSFAAFLDEVESRLGPVDILINNAGIMQLGRFLDESDATAHRMVDINLHGVILGMKLVLPRMQTRNRGHVINIASQAGKAGFPGGATYCATKHAVIGLSEAVRAELRDTDIDVSYVMPAVVNTELGSGLMDARGVKKLEPEEVADAIVDALRYGRVDVWVPRSTKVINRLITLMPRAGAEGIARLLRADRILAEPDTGVRRGYEERASRSEPGLEPDAQIPAEPEREREPV
ncbi:MAG TPA: SDR family oxidoreductase [Solirubrobacteraceae bacterium]|jgi:NADP-dependent 3-hydroxy acid dehydrogenase YdfG|nr:SDR family oxidoreductase [Solirubrobacteraceae bacterium]